jgi:hypothetical protein
MPLNGYPITGEGETCSMEMAAPNPGTPLPLRPARAEANDAHAWMQPTVVPSNSDGAPSPGEVGGITPVGPLP